MSQKLLSICIPTRNRAQVFQKTLDNIISQALEFRDKVEICISNNASTDNTREVVMRFKEKYPDLIIYNENEKNIGFDKNLLKVIKIAEGRFAWTFGDYSFFAEGGLKEVINFIESIDDENVGLIGLRHESYVLDERNNKILVEMTQDKTKPHIIKLNAKGVIEKGSCLRGITFVILNTKLIKKINEENSDLVEMGIGALYMHSWLYYIMFILNKNLECYILNKVISSTPYTPPKTIIEDYFLLTYNGNIRFYGMLESICRERSEYDYANFFSKIKNGTKLGFQGYIGKLKILDQFEYDSYFGCIKLFYHNLKFVDASLFSISFSIISFTPSSFLRMIVKIYLKIKYGKKASSKWNDIIRLTPNNQQGKIRIRYNSKDWRGDDQLRPKYSKF